MFCPKCGKETDASGKYCQWCGAAIEAAAPAKQAVIATPEVEEGPEVGAYAGLGRRFVAWIVDTILIVILGIIVIAFFNLINGFNYLYYIAVRHAPISSLTEAGTYDAALGPIVAAVGVFVIIVPWLYYAGFESSRSQATPGKVLMQLAVTDLAGNRVSFARATLRFIGIFFFAMFIPLLVIVLGFAIIGLTISLAIAVLIILLNFLIIGLTKKRQGIHDRIAGCFVLLQD
jgi:uncharacterized RDD family membrane protein YckC